MAIFRGGYAGRILFVDLSTGKIRVEPLDGDTARKYIGSRGLSARLFWDENVADADPLGPDNYLTFATGPLNGTMIPSGSIFTVGFKSPLTGINGFGTTGGHFSNKIKQAGYDMIAIKGCAEKPVYLHVHNEQVSIRDASHLWGVDGRMTNKLIKEEIGDPDADVAVIGPAGEKLVMGANIMVTMGHSASYGCGPVMGSKNLKAVAVSGTRDINIAEPGKFTRLWREFMDDIMNDPIAMGSGMRYGTTSLLTTANEIGELSTRNFQGAFFAEADKISGETLRQTHLVKTRGCYPCPICCDRFAAVQDGPYKGTWVAGPEYATLTSFGSKFGNSNLPSILRANEICDQFGLDIYFTGDAIAFAAECYQRGILTKKDTDGLDLTWGNYEAMLEMVRKIGSREGIGDLLAEGATNAAKKIGGGADYYAIEIKHMAISSEDPRSNNENALGAMIATRGGDANNNWARTTNFTPQVLKDRWGIDLTTYTEHKPAPGKYSRQGYGDLSHGLPTGVKGIGRMTRWWEDRGVAVDLVGVCKLLWLAYLNSGLKIDSRFGLLTKVYAATTGIDMDEAELVEAANRVHTLEKALNVRAKGVTRKEDLPPARFMKDPVPEGPAKGKVFENPDQFLDEYYESRGWELEHGRPTRECYDRLGMPEVAEYFFGGKKKK